MKTYQSCPVCESKKFNPFLTCNDNTGSDESFNIVKCDSCGFAFTNPIPLEENLGKYYESDEYISHSNTNKGLVNFLYQRVRNYTLNKKVSLLRSLGNGKKILDIGSGTGEFLNQCQINGFEVTGIEPSDKGRKQAKENFNLNVYTEDYLTDISDNSFDFITMWHVLEHVYHLNQRLEELYRIIAPNGYVIIAVPNLKSYDASFYKEFWAAYDVPRHLYHFSPNDIKNLCKKHKFSLVKTLPMKFDSYYVSMLSEKYKNGSSNIFASFLKGFQSNLKAKPELSYSSQIYILQKHL